MAQIASILPWLCKNVLMILSAISSQSLASRKTGVMSLNLMPGLGKSGMVRITSFNRLFSFMKGICAANKEKKSI
jgi:hypothetical protein